MFNGKHCMQIQDVNNLNNIIKLNYIEIGEEWDNVGKDCPWKSMES